MNIVKYHRVVRALNPAPGTGLDVVNRLETVGVRCSRGTKQAFFNGHRLPFVAQADKLMLERGWHRTRADARRFAA